MSIFDLTGKTAVVTGAGRGIGRAIAAALAEAGAAVALVGRGEATLKESQAAISKAGGAASIHVADVSDGAQVEAALASVLARHGGLDVLVNNAGISPVYASLEKTDIEDWRRVMAVNLDGVFHCCKIFGGHCLERGAGSIINISSIAGRLGLARQTAYCASKGGVEQLTKALALDWAARGVRVNAVAYGFIETDLTAGLRDHEKLSRKLLERTPMNRFGRLDEVVGAAVFLASDAASYITGASLAVDGGWSAG